jgi:hypothetical protein
LVIGFVDNLQIVIINKYNAIADSHSAIHYSTNLSLLSLLCLGQSSGNGFQRRTLPFLWVSELSSCHSYHDLTTARKE